MISFRYFDTIYFLLGYFAGLFISRLFDILNKYKNTLFLIF